MTMGTETKALSEGRAKQLTLTIIFTCMYLVILVLQYLVRKWLQGTRCQPTVYQAISCTTQELNNEMGW